MSSNPYRDLPPVDALADQIGHDLPRRIAVATARAALETARDQIAADETPDVAAIATRLARSLAREAGTRILNATGVLLHTNLGRAAWSSESAAAAGAVAVAPTNVELDLTTGERGRRGAYLEALLIEATGAEAAIVVNNNAAAVLLTLAATAQGRGVPVSRGELIEIGGSYRLPEVMEASGARLIEVGTTNRTRPDDYSVALQTHDCGAILKVHPSNYRLEGFTEEASLGRLASIADDTGLPLIYDQGSGWLDEEVPWAPSWLRGEPGAKQSLIAGANVVMFSGDKLLGGPQAGVIVGSADIIGQLRRNPLARALRVDGPTQAALAATVEAHLSSRPETIPFWRQALAEDDEIERRATTLAQAVGGSVERGESRVGAGSAPAAAIPTHLVRIASRQDLFLTLLDETTPILTRRDGGDLLVDLRSIDPVDDPLVASVVQRCQ